MTIFDIIYFNRELIDRLKASGIRLNDTRFIALFSDFNDMLALKLKVSYIVAVLASRYNVSERTVYSVVKRFRSRCNPFSS